jgi:hypothetical protein
METESIPQLQMASQIQIDIKFLKKKSNINNSEGFMKKAHIKMTTK